MHGKKLFKLIDNEDSLLVMVFSFNFIAMQEFRKSQFRKNFLVNIMLQKTRKQVININILSIRAGLGLAPAYSSDGQNDIFPLLQQARDQFRVDERAFPCARLSVKQYQPSRNYKRY